MSNIGRSFLVTKFNCAECGTDLELSYEPRGGSRQSGFEDNVSDGITRASKKENFIFIEPCKKCVKEANKDMDTSREIFKKNNIGGESK